MKNKIIGILLCFLIFTFPAMAEVAPNVILNGIAYVPSDKVLVKDDMIYLSTTDLALLTLAKIEQSTPEKYTLSIGDDTLTICSDSKRIRINNDTLVSAYGPFIKEDIFYVPISILDMLKFPYTLSGTSLSIGPIMPYSRNEDDYKEHTFIATLANLETIPSHLISFSSDEAVKSIISSSLTDKSYLSFINNDYRANASDLFQEQLRRSPYNNIQVIMRKVNSLSSPQTISSFEVKKLSVIPYAKSLEAKIGEDALSYQPFWTTFMPSESLTQMDLNKSIDTTLMHMVYEYYRNKFNFKDDKFFSPFAVVTSGRTNTLVHDVYTLVDGKEEDYTIKVHRIHPSGSIIFLVDIYAK